MENVFETEILAGLNEPQKNAVQHTTGPLLVLAGAGSGKTRVLTHRVAYLIRECGVDPRAILAVTFTNKAAEEMRQRIYRLVGTAAVHVWIMTFHSACVRILREDGDAIGLDRHFVIYDTVDQLAVVRKALAALNLSEKEHNPRAILASISSAKNDLLNAQEFMDKAADFWAKNVAKIYVEYQKILSRNQALDFDDLIMKTVALFERAPQVLDKYQERFKYIMVDEYQDTNHAQYMLVNALAAKHRNLCVVGDDDQSIYGFRKADIRNILEFERDYPEVTVVKLEQNYRSTGKILECANAVVSNNRGRKKKRLWTENPAGENIYLYRAEDEKEEAHFIISEIAKMTAVEGRPYKDFAILYRANAQSRALEEAFTARGLPYRILGGLRFYDRKEIRDLLAYLRLIANPADMISFERAIGAPRRGIGDTSIEKFFNFVRFSGLTVTEALLRADEVPGLQTRAREALRNFGKMITSLAERSAVLTVSELTERVLEESGYRRELESEDTIESQGRLENLMEFFSVTREYEAKNEDTSLAGFLESVSLVSDVDNYQRDADAVVMMTLHAAKGLEFPVVFISGMEEGVFPNERCLQATSELEEERRICYVGITRAKEKLYLTYAGVRTLYGRSNYSRVSRFVGEIPVSLIMDLNVRLRNDHYFEAGAGRNSSSRDFGRSDAAFVSGISGNGGRRGGSHDINSNAAENALLKVGDHVVHQKFGRGTIVAVKGEGEQASFSVAFPGIGIKELLAAYAPLQKAE